MRVCRGGDHVRRLVQQVVDESWLCADTHAVDRDLVGRRVSLVAEGCHPTIDGDPTVLDQLLTGTATTEPYASEDLLDALTRGWLPTRQAPGPVRALRPHPRPVRTGQDPEARRAM